MRNEINESLAEFASADAKEMQSFFPATCAAEKIQISRKRASEASALQREVSPHAAKRNIALRLQYDGSAYHGWQVQKTEVTVAETLEKALSKVMKHPVKVVGCGRTDAGVHALRYCANFRTDSTIPIERFPLAVNSRLPADIAVTDAVEAPEDFNAIGSCIKKEYIYKIHNSNLRDPFLEKRACFYPQRLDVEKMNAAAHAFEGTHDFAAVRSVGTETKTTVRTVHWCRAESAGDLITIAVCADGFPLPAKNFTAACRPPSLTLEVTQARISGLADWVRPRDCRVCLEVNPRPLVTISKRTWRRHVTGFVGTWTLFRRIGGFCSQA